MPYEHNDNPLPHSGDCGCRICMTHGPGLLERDLWRNPDNHHDVRLRVADSAEHTGTPGAGDASLCHSPSSSLSREIFTENEPESPLEAPCIPDGNGLPLGVPVLSLELTLAVGRTRQIVHITKQPLPGTHRLEAKAAAHRLVLERVAYMLDLALDVWFDTLEIADNGLERDTNSYDD